MNFFLSQRMFDSIAEIQREDEMTKSQVVRSALVAYIKDWRLKNEPDGVSVKRGDTS